MRVVGMVCYVTCTSSQCGGLGAGCLGPGRRHSSGLGEDHVMSCGGTGTVHLLSQLNCLTQIHFLMGLPVHTAQCVYRSSSVSSSSSSSIDSSRKCRRSSSLFAQIGPSASLLLIAEKTKLKNFGNSTVIKG